MWMWVKVVDVKQGDRLASVRASVLGGDPLLVAYAEPQTEYSTRLVIAERNGDSEETYLVLDNEYAVEVIR